MITQEHVKTKDGNNYGNIYKNVNVNAHKTKEIFSSSKLIINIF